jgi:hypothetical protein
LPCANGRGVEPGTISDDYLDETVRPNGGTDWFVVRGSGLVVARRRSQPYRALTSGHIRGVAGLAKRHERTNHSIEEQRTMLPFQFDNWAVLPRR